jgi:hypothetical protein
MLDSPYGTTEVRLAMGPFHARSSALRQQDDGWYVVKIPTAAFDGAPGSDNLLRMRFLPDLLADIYSWPAGMPLATGLQLADLRSGLCFDIPGMISLDGPALIPHFALTTVGDQLTCYAQIRISMDDLLFLRMPEEIPDNPNWLNSALELLDRHSLFLNNHQCFFTKYQEEVEIEHKITLFQEPDLLVLANATCTAIASGEFPGYLTEYRDEFQQWDFFNYLFEIPGPPDEAGYVSFIPTTDGRYTVKRKKFKEDTRARHETRQRGVSIELPFTQHVQERMGLRTSWGMGFRRFRYDISCESRKTGHVFAIMFDRSTPIGPHGKPLRGVVNLTQCEIEYMYSRTLSPIDGAIIFGELEEVIAWVRALLVSRGITFTENDESKLTYLRRVRSAFVANDARLDEVRQVLEQPLGM